MSGVMLEPTMPALSDLEFDPGSFRDPGGRVLDLDGRILRIITDRAAEDYRWIRDAGIMDDLVRSGRLVSTRELEPIEVGLQRSGVRHVLEHARIPFLSYPYEWAFSALKAAALLHLDLHLAMLARGATLIDSSAYNVQFVAAEPIFIDALSLRRYREGEIWAGHRQFCEQFLNPLLLQSLHGVAFNRWYRGAMEGIPTADFAALLTWRQKSSWRVLTHVVAPAQLHRAVQSGRVGEQTAAKKRTLPKASLVGLIGTLRRWIARLEPRGATDGEWATYATTNSYKSEEASAKRRFVAEFAAACRPRQLLDLGCNTGDYAAAALEGGAASVIGLEADPATADKAFRRARAQQLKFLPLIMDAADPSPSRGWREAERRALSQRADFDGLIALAFEHHLAIGRNVPLDQLVSWIVGLAPRGVIEFVQKDDPTVQRMLALREDIFDDYSQTAFTSLLSRRARIVKQERISEAGRILFWYERDAN
jgi:ribosomal protein L11 methylase PrmA